ncbi:Two-component response regulator-like APRR5 [Citrus sinensis]|uniref:two-component response regulator-like APRR5 isoform X1 n=2 Tax=Citrus sinensis TaxID=2711 RepID=UPI00218D8820|nr:two-component response regulator-like APRR5 isoform X1 [Citrus sinensis]KAH9724421.1 Two-component response regulator-like APRR5 [Citrus sinensis]
MGDVVLNDEELKEMNGNEGISKWERFLQRMALRVLLVEADDSTRQIVTALLRKSSYRVTAVPDGLKAWEVLKGRPRNIDLILTEVDLPSISGFALLTLVMEHEICKNIPVIMMSSQDSVSTVYKCMMRGAADYLVKPVRRNELRNLWQHVWRRQSSMVSGNETQDESVGQQKIEATSENDAASNHSSGYMACIQSKGEFIEKGSDEQSSCTKPDFEAESAHVEDMRDMSRQLWGKSLQNDVKMQNHEARVNYGQKSLVPVTEAQGSEVAACKEANTRAHFDEDTELETHRSDVILTSEVCNVPVNSPRQVIDFMSTFNNHKPPSNNGASKFDSSPQLDLSLRRTHPDGFENQVMERKFILRHSNASAFTRYTNKPSEPQHSSLSGVCNQQKEFETDSEKNFSNILTACNSYTPAATLSTQRSVNSLATGHSKQSELAVSHPQQRPCPVPVSVKVNSTNQAMHKLDHKLDSLEDLGHISPATDQSASSSFCNGAVSRLNSMGYGSACGSNSNLDQVTAGRAAAESKNEEGLFPSNGNLRSIQREAALNKFRLKRKDRCYDKKVRYESRKKLAEQRPRVKGQFVRQVHSETLPLESENHSGNISDG